VFNQAPYSIYLPQHTTITNSFRIKKARMTSGFLVFIELTLTVNLLIIAQVYRQPLVSKSTTNDALLAAPDTLI